jgi:hypothetical protein
MYMDMPEIDDLADDLTNDPKTVPALVYRLTQRSALNRKRAFTLATREEVSES